MIFITVAPDTAHIGQPFGLTPVFRKMTLKGDDTRFYKGMELRTAEKAQMVVGNESRDNLQGIPRVWLGVTSIPGLRAAALGLERWSVQETGIQEAGRSL